MVNSRKKIKRKILKDIIISVINQSHIENDQVGNELFFIAGREEHIKMIILTYRVERDILFRERADVHIIGGWESFIMGSMFLARRDWFLGVRKFGEKFWKDPEIIEAIENKICVKARKIVPN